MNILFYTHGKVYSTRGGTERTTVTVASALKRYYGCRCYSLYEVFEDMPKEDCFEEEFQWIAGHDRLKDLETLRKIVADNGIDYIIDQGIFINVQLLSEAVKGKSCKVILAHHYSPGAETLYMSFISHWLKRSKKMTLRRRCRWLLDLLLYPYAKYQYDKQLKSTYREAYENAYRVVLLSESFIKPYQEFSGFNDDNKFVVIPNALSFDDILPEADIVNKKHVVLIVSRIEETHKRLSLALKIWKQVKKSPVSAGWGLKIVGTGERISFYEDMVRKEQIPDVSFEGHQDPRPYYKEASLFMMTSRSESWGLTLTEAQQMGVVPIAFDSYSSLHDIITNEVDGIFVDECNIPDYKEKMLDLMNNQEKRRVMARNAIHNCKRYSKERVAEKWYNLLDML